MVLNEEAVKREKIRTHVFVSGRVQGVYFRKSTKKKAKKLNVFGWVRNLSDGRVEAIFEGEENMVEQIIDWCKKGPVFAKVEDMEAIKEEYKGEFSGFEVL